jgi:hypothetical protein
LIAERSFVPEEMMVSRIESTGRESTPFPNHLQRIAKNPHGEYRYGQGIAAIERIPSKEFCNELGSILCKSCLVG